MSIIPFFILPILSGYWLCLKTLTIRHKLIRESGHKLYFRSLYYGIWLGILGAFSHISLWAHTESHVKEDTWYYNAVGLFQKYASDGAKRGEAVKKPKIRLFSNGSIILSLVYSFLWSHILILLFNSQFMFSEVDLKSRRDFLGELYKTFNSIKEGSRKRRDKFIERALKDRDFELMLWTAWRNLTPLTISLSNNKVYVGTIVRMINPNEPSTHIRVLPTVSGYRKEDTLEVEYTEFYVSVYKKIINTKSKLNLSDFEVVIPTDVIISLQNFDAGAFGEFARQKKARLKANATLQKKRVRVTPKIT